MASLDVITQPERREHAGTRTRVLVLGAGPAGLGAAYRLTRLGRAEVTVLEQQAVVGGNAGSFQVDGVHVDFGSHRLHPACDPAILNDIRSLLGDDLLDRPRHGRIRLQGRWIHFPLKPLDLLLRVPPAFAAGVLRDSLFKGRTIPGGKETFASELQRGLGRTISQEFYFPYARKLWGLDPEDLSPTQARRRVSAGSIKKMIRKVASAVPGLKPPGAGRFFYPRLGFGQICQGIYQAAQGAGAEFHLGARVIAVEHENGRVRAVRYEQGGGEQRVETDHVWSTLPITVLARALDPAPPAPVLEAAAATRFRGMILIYLVLGQARFTEFDAHYFPGADIPMSRLSEPKNYSASTEPRDRTVLCAELPADPDSPYWAMSDDELGQQMCEWLGRAGLPVRAPVVRTVTRRLRQAYPVYQLGYERNFEVVDQHLQRISGLLIFGRQGLFVHDNTHHALFMAYSAADCLRPDGNFDHARWRDFRRVFETHVVED